MFCFHKAVWGKKSIIIDKQYSFRLITTLPYRLLSIFFKTFHIIRFGYTACSKNLQITFTVFIFFHYDFTDFNTEYRYYWDSSRANFLSKKGQNSNIYKGFLSKAGQNSNSQTGNHTPLQEYTNTSILTLHCSDES